MLHTFHCQYDVRWSFVKILLAVKTILFIFTLNKRIFQGYFSREVEAGGEIYGAVWGSERNELKDKQNSKKYMKLEEV